MNAMPRRLEPAKQDLAKLDAIVAVEKANLEENESWRQQQEELIQSEEDAIRKAKVKLQSAKNSRDYTAASRELEINRRSKSEREDEVLKMMQALEQSRADVSAHASEIDVLRSHIDAEESKIAGLVETLATEADEYARGRDGIVEQLPKQLLKRYDLVMLKRGSAVASVVKGTCQGCYMEIPPQLNNVLARFNSIETCPRCNRLLYREELLAEKEDA